MASPSKAYLEDHGHSFALSLCISSFFPVRWSIDDPLLVRWLGESTNSQNQGQWETSSTHLLKLPLGAILLDIRDIKRAKLSSVHRYIGMLLSQLPKMCAPGIFADVWASGENGLRWPPALCISRRSKAAQSWVLAPTMRVLGSGNVAMTCHTTRPLSLSIYQSMHVLPPSKSALARFYAAYWNCPPPLSGQEPMNSPGSALDRLIFCSKHCAALGRWSPIYDHRPIRAKCSQ